MPLNTIDNNVDCASRNCAEKT